ncbi:MAG: PHB depolymerase family esterase [Gemmataceae bacterium]
MHRAIAILLLFPLSLMAQKKPDFESLLARNTFTSGKTTLFYRFLKPEKIEEKTKYPLVIFLHGAGERGDDNTKQLVHGVGDFAKSTTRKKHPCFLIAPQCPEGRRWVEVDWSAPTHNMPKAASEPATLLLALIDQVCKEYPIDKNRIYLTGLSMGGYGTWDLLCRKPTLFAAGIPVCGGGDEKHAKKLVGIPIWAFHGDKDLAVKVERSRNMIEAIKKAGGEPKYTEYPGVGHDSWTRTYKNPEVLDWLFAQTRKK